MIKDLPKEWKEYKISDIGTVVTGNTPPKKDPENYGGELVWIKPPDLDKKMFVSKSEETISDIGKKKVRLLPKGSVLVSCIGNIGKVAISECKLCTNQQINSIIPNREIVDSVFLYYTIKRMRPYLENIASSAVVPLLNKNDFSKVKITLPTLKTQKKIVEILERAEKLKEWRAEADELADEFLKSVFLEMFGDPYKNEKQWNKQLIKDCISIPLTSGWSPKCSDEKGGINVFSLANLNGSGLTTNTDKYYYGKEPTKGFDLEMEDILISRSNTVELVGRAGMYQGKPKKVIYPDLMIRIRVNKDILNPFFFEKYLQTDSTKKLIQKVAHGTSASMVKISQKTLGNLQVIIPPIELQNQFAEIVKQVETLKTHQKESKQQIYNLFNALMQKAFKGELTC